MNKPELPWWAIPLDTPKWHDGLRGIPHMVFQVRAARMLQELSWLNKHGRLRLWDPFDEKDFLNSIRRTQCERLLTIGECNKIEDIWARNKWWCKKIVKINLTKPKTECKL